MEFPEYERGHLSRRRQRGIRPSRQPLNAHAGMAPGSLHAEINDKRQMRPKKMRLRKEYVN